MEAGVELHCWRVVAAGTKHIHIGIESSPAGKLNSAPGIDEPKQHCQTFPVDRSVVPGEQGDRCTKCVWGEKPVTSLGCAVLASCY